MSPNRIGGPPGDDASTIVPLLVVDDEEPIRNALKRYLTKQGFSVHTAGSGDEALAALRSHEDIALMLCDIRMPGTSGVDLVPQALEASPDLAILMLTAVNDATTAALCMQRGALDYLTKPIELLELGRAVQRALRRREMLIGTRALDQQLKQEIERRTAEFQRERSRLERVSVATLEALINALEAKDPYLRGHSARVADLAATIADHLGLPEEQVESIRVAGRLHDIGKIGTREEVMNKQGTLTPEEYDHIKQHVIIGSQILAPLEHLHDVIGGVRGHHERWDGAGYPDGLKGEEIPMAARIIGASEVYDALSTSRPYQEKMTTEQAVRRISELVGTVLDPKVVAALAEVVTRRRSLVFLVDEGAGGGRDLEHELGTGG
jgi:putative nucleotidyltransferase with HDIG domain